MKRVASITAIILALTACGGGSNDADAIAEQIIEQAGAEGVDISTDDDGNINLTIEDEGIDISTDDEGMNLTIEGEDGTGQASLGGDLPADFPLPLPDNYEVGTSMQLEDEAGTSYTTVIQISGEEFDSTQAMYESWLEDEGFTVDTLEMQSSDTRGAVITGERDDVSAYLNMTLEVIANDDAGNLTYASVITMAWTPNG